MVVVLKQREFSQNFLFTQYVCHVLVGLIYNIYVLFNADQICRGKWLTQQFMIRRIISFSKSYGKMKHK